MRRGSAFEITARAGISSPLASTTPVAAPSFTPTRATSAPVRISAPACLAAEAIAWVNAPIPPRTKVTPPAASPPSAAARSRSAAPVPADHGPRKLPKIPRPASVPRRSSVSNHSATRSATAIGPQRSRRNMSFFPRARNFRPAFSRPQRSPPEGASTEGGISDSRSARTDAMRPRARWNSGYFSASLRENAAIPCAVRPGSP